MRRGWLPERSPGIWRHGVTGLRPFIAAAPFLTVLLLLVLFLYIGQSFSLARGTLFELPTGAGEDALPTDLVALVLPQTHETLVFFDDARYLLNDAASVHAFGEQVRERTSHTAHKTLLILADRRVSAGDLMRLNAVVREHGVARVLFAEKPEEAVE